MYGLVEEGEVNVIFEVEDVADLVGDEGCSRDWNLCWAKLRC